MVTIQEPTGQVLTGQVLTGQELTGEALMSRLFGDIRQIGIVVRDIEKAMAH